MPYSNVEPGEEHDEEVDGLEHLVHIHCHLEHSHEYVREVHKKHDDSADGQEVDGVREEHEGDGEDVVEQELGEVPAVSVEQHIQHHLVAVVSELDDVDVVQEVGDGLAGVVLEEVDALFSPGEALVQEITLLQTPKQGNASCAVD